MRNLWDRASRRLASGSGRALASGQDDGRDDSSRPRRSRNVPGPGVAFGVRRLSIVDVEGGHQPFFNEDRAIVAIQNGELYNHAAIRDELRSNGHRFDSRCDTEILPHLYEQVGTGFPERLRGKFGIAVWDGSRRRVVLARDRLGVKPLYWATVGDLVIFGSELKSVLASGLVEPDIDLRAIDTYLTLGFVPGPATVLQNVHKLQPGHRLVAGQDGVTEERYWTYPTQASGTSRSDPESCADQLLEHLREAVRLRLMSDVPLGAMLSGGVDSSLVVALMAELSSTPVKTFTVGFAGRDNELPKARRVAELFGCDHHELQVRGDATELDELVWFLDEPVADLSALGFLRISQLAAEHVTVALAGQGADELFGGYRKYRAVAAARLLSPFPWRIRSTVGAILGKAPGSVGLAARATLAPSVEALELALLEQIDDDSRRRLYIGALANERGKGALEAIIDRKGAGNGNPLGTIMSIDAQFGLVDDMLHYFDRTSMAASLEVRVPFLDHELVEWAASVPTSLKIHGRTTKSIVKRAAGRYLPDDIVHGRKVGFFRNSVEDWLQRKLAADHGERFSAGSPIEGFLDMREVRALVGRVQMGRATRAELNLVLAVTVLESWLRSALPRSLAASRTR